MPTPLYPISEKRVADAVEQLLQKQVTPWAFFGSGKPFRVHKFDGSEIPYQVIEFEGSPREVFWSRYIDPFLEDLSVREIDAAVKMADERGVDAKLLLSEVQSLLLKSTRIVFDRMAEIDRRLIGKGYPNNVPLRPVENEVRGMAQFIEKRIAAEIAMWRSKFKQHETGCVSRDTNDHKMKRPIEIFFSYAHEDESLMDEVRRQLIGYDRRKVIRKWHDRKISPGTDLKGQIDHRLEHSDIILLFISPHFIASDYCYEAEMKEAMRRHDEGRVRVIPVILRPCLWHDEPFGKLLALPTDGKALTQWQNRDEGSADAADGIMRVVKELAETHTITE